MLMTCTPHSNKAFLLHRMRSFHVRISTETTVSSVLTNQAENIIREHNPALRSLSHPVTFYSPWTHTHFYDLFLRRTGESGLQIFSSCMILFEQMWMLARTEAWVVYIAYSIYNHVWRRDDSWISEHFCWECIRWKERFLTDRTQYCGCIPHHSR